MKKKSGLLKVLGAIVLLAAGVIIGKTFFSSNSPTAVPIPSTMKYRNVGQSKDTTQAANKDFSCKRWWINPKSGSGGRARRPYTSVSRKISRNGLYR